MSPSDISMPFGRLTLSSGSAQVDRARIMAGTQEVNNHVSHVQRAIVRLETAVSDPVLKNPLDPTKDMPLFIEDPLGNSIEIPLDLVHSWEVSQLSPRVTAQHLGRL